MYETTEDGVGSGASEEKDLTDVSVNQLLFMEICDSDHDYIPVYTDDSRDGNSLICATVFPSNTVIFMRFSDSTFIFTAEIWTIIKSLEEIKNLFCQAGPGRLAVLLQAVQEG